MDEQSVRKCTGHRDLVEWFISTSALPTASGRHFEQKLVNAVKH